MLTTEATRLYLSLVDRASLYQRPGGFRFHAHSLRSWRCPTLVCRRRRRRCQQDLGAHSATTVETYGYVPPTLAGMGEAAGATRAETEDANAALLLFLW